MKKTNFIKHIESLYELGVIKKDEEMRYKKLYHKSSESLKETMDENPQFIVNRFNEDLNKRIQNRILNNVVDAKGLKPTDPEFDNMTARFIDEFTPPGGGQPFAQGGLAKILEL